MDGHGVGRFGGDALADVELHALVADALQGTVDGAVWVGDGLLFSPSGSHCS